MGNVTSIDEGSGGVTHRHDRLHRLESVENPGHPQYVAYTYDAVGNRRTETRNGGTRYFVPGIANRLAEIRGKQFALRGGPDQDRQGLTKQIFGDIVVRAAPFNRDFPDFAYQLDTFQQVGVVQRDFADSVANAIEFERVTNQGDIGYYPLGPNSNSVATTFVESLAGVRPTSSLLAPGNRFGTPSEKISYAPAPLVQATYPSSTESVGERAYAK